MANKYIYPANGRVNTQIASVGDSKVNKEEMKEKVKLLSENLSLISYNKIRAELPILCMNSNCVASFAPHDKRVDWYKTIGKSNFNEYKEKNRVTEQGILLLFN